jgi:ATP-dependent exoDNAse (exonuclease V) beta subunit
METTAGARNTLVIYRSSAGSGKTFTLTREYLYLALKSGDVRAYRKILAVTFTNKAMQEMKDRIIKKLSEFASGKTDDPMAADLIQRLEWDDRKFVELCSELLSEILHNYSHFSITTIDAFFQQIIRSFARELHISGGYRLELEQDLVYRQVVQDLMNAADNDDHIKKWLEEFSFAKLDSAKGWEVDKELVAFLKELDSESFKRHEEEISSYSDDLYNQLKESCFQIISGFERAIIQLGKRGMELIERSGLTRNDFFGGHAANFIYYAQEGVFRTDKKKGPTKTFRSCLDNGGWFKKSLDSDLLPNTEQLLASDFSDVASDLLATWDSGERDYRTAQAVYQNIYVFALSVKLLSLLSEFKKENDILFISDATRMIRELVTQTDTPFIYEKVGSFYDHFLIDEFQDTSRFQWDSFRPLIENSLAEGKSNYIVGDVKQSIYRWRGGDLQLLQTEVESDFKLFDPIGKNLDTNYRSRKNIVEFNNTLFEYLPAKLKKSFDNKLLPSFDVESRLKNIFIDVKQKFSGKDSDPPGYVEGRIFRSQDEFKDVVFTEIIDTLKGLQDRKVPLRDIAILVRDNKEGKDIAEFLMTYGSENQDKKYRYDVVSNETLHLSASTGVNAMIAALRFIDNPEDTVSRSAILFFINRLNKSDAAESVFLDPDEKILDRIAELKTLPLYSMIERLIGILRLEYSAWEFPYLQTLQDHALAYMKRERGDVAGFLQLWDDKLHKESIRVADDLDAVRILTIHKSKGLEFHSVILPFLNWQWNKSKGIDWYRLNGLPVELSALIPVNYSGNLMETHFNSDYANEVFRHYLDNLNLLYVALTRARHDLWFMFDLGKEKNEKLNRISGVLYDLLTDDQFPLSGHFDKTSGRFQYGNQLFEYAEGSREEVKTVQLDSYISYNWRQALTLKPVPDRLRNEERRISISAGLLVHDILSRISYSEDVKMAIEDIRFTVGLSDDEVKGLQHRIEEAFRNHEVKGWFDHTWEVRNEQGIFAGGEEYRPDRVIHREGTTLVIDYKTGEPKKADLDQVKTYLSIVRELYDGVVEGRILYLENMHIETVL